MARKELLFRLFGVKIDEPDRHIAGMRTVAAGSPHHRHPLDQLFGQFLIAGQPPGLSDRSSSRMARSMVMLIKIFGRIDFDDGFT